MTVDSNKTIKTSWTISVSVPHVPNFLLEDSFGSEEKGKYPISDFDDKTLRLIGEAWTENLIHRASEMRKLKCELKS